jgi:hypothetical protein
MTVTLNDTVITKISRNDRDDIASNLNSNDLTMTKSGAVRQKKCRENPQYKAREVARKKSSRIGHVASDREKALNAARVRKCRQKKKEVAASLLTIYPDDPYKTPNARNRAVNK